MPDREKVIRGLECCVDGCSRECPYFDSGDGCWFVLAAGALALLKAQTPKMLALDEIHRGMAVWLEDVDKADVILAIGGSSAGGAKCFIAENDMSIVLKDAEYGIWWRAWTQEPTEEQRKEAEWDA